MSGISENIIVILSICIVSLFVTSLYHKHKQINQGEVELLLFYGSFDKDQDGTLSIEEIVDFFDWCQSNIKYKPHRHYQSPVKTFKTRRGDCLDQSLLIAHFLSVFYHWRGLVGNIVAGNQQKRVNHACCLLPVSRNNKNQINRFIGYEISCFNVPYDDLFYIIVDPLYCDKFGKLETSDYSLTDIKGLQDYSFNDMTSIRISR